jgi:hypothetical protein
MSFLSIFSQGFLSMSGRGGGADTGDLKSECWKNSPAEQEILSYIVLYKNRLKTTALVYN